MDIWVSFDCIERAVIMVKMVKISWQISYVANHFSPFMKAPLLKLLLVRN